MGQPSARFLVLDDQLVLRKLIVRQAESFSSRDIEVDEFSDPVDALRSLEAKDYDLIITDIGMPGMNGIDFIKSLAVLGYKGSLLVISGYDEKMLKAIAQMAERLGMREARFLCKPYSVGEFDVELAALESGMEHQVVVGLDVSQLLGGMCEQEFQLRLEPILSLPGRRLQGFCVSAIVMREHVVSIPQGLFALLEHRREAMMPVLELLVERIARLRQQCHEDCVFELGIDADCLAAEHLLDGCISILRRSGMPPRQLVFSLADGLTPQMPSLVYENIAKIRFLGMRLVANRFGEGTLTLANLFRLPFDQLNLSMPMLRWLWRATGEDDELLHLLRLFGFGVGSICACGVSSESDLELVRAMGCQRVRGHYLAAALGEEALADYVAGQVVEAGALSSE